MHVADAARAGPVTIPARLLRIAAEANKKYKVQNSVVYLSFPSRYPETVD